MAGPCASILLKEEFRTHNFEDLRTWLQGRIVKDESTLVPEHNSVPWESKFRIGADGDPAVNIRDGQPFSIDVEHIDPAGPDELRGYRTEADLRRIIDALGWMPRGELGVVAYCNRHQDHYLLGWMVTELAIIY